MLCVHPKSNALVYFCIKEIGSGKFYVHQFHTRSVSVLTCNCNGNLGVRLEDC